MRPQRANSVQKEYMNRLSGGLFDQKANTLYFDRETKLTKELVKQTLKTIKRAQKKGEYLIVTPESLQCLALKADEIRREGQDNDETRALRKDLSKIFSLFGDDKKGQGILLLDEADRILDIRRELNFTIGDPESLPKSCLEELRSLFDFLVAEEKAIGLCANQQGARLQGAWPSLKDRLASKLAEKVNRDFSIGIKDEQLIELATFLKDLQVTKVPECLSGLSLEKLDRIGLIRAQLTVFLSITLSKSGRKDYTSSEDSSVIVSIPAHLCQAAEGSRFGTAYEAMNYTTQLILQYGMSATHIAEAIDKIRLQAMQQFEKGTPIDEIEACVKFSKLYPEKKLLQTFDNKDYETIADRLKSNPILLLDFAEQFVLPQLEVYRKKAAYNAHRLLGMFKHTYGFTGTPWNWGAWPKSLGKPVFDEGTDGLTIQLLQEKEKAFGNKAVITSSLPQAPNAKQSLIKTQVFHILDSFIGPGKLLENNRSFIDLGVVFKPTTNDSNREVAQAILDYFNQPDRLQNPPIQGVVFFIKDELFVLMQDGRVIPYAKCDLPAENRYTFYDSAHTIGTDIPQAILAEAIVTIGENLYLKDLLQAVWRMRGLAALQSVVFFVPEEKQTLDLPAAQER